MIKPQKNSPRAHLKDLNSPDPRKEIRSPVDLYNTRIRKEGQPILTEEEYTNMMREKFKRRKSEPGETMFIIIGKDEVEAPVDSNFIKEMLDFAGVKGDTNFHTEKKKEPDATT